MENPDIQIAELKKVRRKHKFTNIEDGLFIGDMFVKFSARDILEGIECLIPEEFIDMPEEVQLMKYPSVSRPQRILTSLDSRVNFAFSLLKENISLHGGRKPEIPYMQCRKKGNLLRFIS